MPSQTAQAQRNAGTSGTAAFPEYASSRSDAKDASVFHPYSRRAAPRCVMVELVYGRLNDLTCQNAQDSLPALPALTPAASKRGRRSQTRWTDEKRPATQVLGT